MPSQSSPAAKGKQCSLWVHDRAFSQADVLLHPAYLPSNAHTRQSLLKITSLDHGKRGWPHYLPSELGPKPGPGRPPAPSNHAPGQFRQADKHPLVFVAQALSEQQRARHSNLQVSVFEGVALLHGLRHHANVIVEAVRRCSALAFDTY